MICRSCKGTGEHHLDTQCNGIGNVEALNELKKSIRRGAFASLWLLAMRSLNPADDGPEVEIIRRLKGK